VDKPTERARIEFEGIVQGVGFRPFLHRLAQELCLAGWALNSSAGVLLELEGRREQLEAFVSRVAPEAPPLSRILVTRVRYLPALGFSGFTIKPSIAKAQGLTLLCPDVATCPDCIRELFDPADRRYRYPFINCTNCGPRYTIVRGLPYDRPQTTMADFALCPDCRREYTDVHDRRYHAQPIACPACGPQLWLETAAGARMDGDPIALAARMLKAGAVLALKGLGGFHLACRADADDAVLTLRRRKQRSFFKPLAVMLPGIEAVLACCEVDAAAREWLCSPQAPVVLVPLKAGPAGAALSRFVAPNLDRIGVMLPYTPLHHLLLAEAGLPLVMTSGNLSDEPLVADNATARAKLGPLAEALLLHDRPVHARCDDSVLAADAAGGCTMLRHSRGFSPFPLALPGNGPSVLAFGGDIKTTFAVSREHFAFLSPHLGDADQLATYQFFRETWEHYRRLFDLHPDAVACDMHPGYHTARWAAELAQELKAPLLTVQHHHAHLVSLLTEHGLPGPLPAIVADGAGYGEDGAIWGGELLYGAAGGYERLAHLRPIQLLGGDAAVHEPWRIALALIHDAAPKRVDEYCAQLLDGSLDRRVMEQLPGRVVSTLDPGWTAPDAHAVRLAAQLIRSGQQCAPSTALGRLFDGVAALLGLTLRTTYEGQAPMELEALPDTNECNSILPYIAMEPLDGMIDWRPLIRQMLNEHYAPAQASWILHRWVVEAFIRALLASGRISAPGQLLASGGCMQNARLKRLLEAACAKLGIKLITHREIPAGDGGLALGILRVAQDRLVDSA
jgi:hydrogenase maturation protein HypF